ncbi:CHAT domain-containing protein [Sorangium sp. So ce448]|uniref:CHAT domain-containing protein n=1 Tax=Sorangium sp. So ce448 TaxID=3133314 RepID=UPI003F5D5ACC
MSGGRRSRTARRLSTAVFLAGLSLAPHAEQAAQPRDAARPKDAAPELGVAESLRRSGKLDEAEAQLLTLLGDPRAAVQAQAVGKLARIARTRGDAAKAKDLLYQAMRMDRAAGLRAQEISDGMVLVFTLITADRRFGEAREVMDSLRPLLAEDPAARADALYYEALIPYEAGDFRAALRLLREAQAEALRLGMARARFDALQLEATLLSNLGRSGDALDRFALLEDQLPSELGHCDRAAFFNNAGWAALRAEMAIGEGAPRKRDPIPLLDRARGLYQQGPCREGANLANVFTNLAIAELDQGRSARAREHLDSARAADPNPSAKTRAWWLILEGRMALAEGAVERTLLVASELAGLGASGGLPEAQIEAAMTRALAEERRGSSGAADEAFAEAERRIEDWSLSVPLGEGRDDFLAQRERGARLWIEALLRRPGGEAAAVEVARRGRARLLATSQWLSERDALPPDERSRWEEALSRYRGGRAALEAALVNVRWDAPAATLNQAVARYQDGQDRLRVDLEGAAPGLRRLRASGSGVERADPAPGELVLVYHPVEEGWVGFALTTAGVAARRLGVVDLRAPHERLAAQLLGPFAGLIRSAEQIRLVPYGSLQGVDFHALPLEGQPLAALAPVAYGVELPRKRGPEGAVDREGGLEPPAPDGAPARPVALLVIDPGDSLPRARDEGDQVEAALTQRGWRVERLDGERATYEAVMRALAAPAVELLHFAGHADFSGLDGWKSGLCLAHDGRLTVADILALPRTPAQVVLSGCETGRAEGLGLAQAFVVAGSGAVVSSLRRIDDGVAARTMRSFYTALPLGAPDDPALALREAALRIRAEEPAADWASFRVIVP